MSPLNCPPPNPSPHGLIMKLKDSFGTKNYGAKKPKQETILNHGKFTGNINKKLKNNAG